MLEINTPIHDLKNHQLESGFTLIELMVTIALLAILMAVATPSFVSYRRNSELTSITNTFAASVNAARSESLKINKNVLVVPTNNDDDWSQGWYVFVDMDFSGTYNSGDIILMSQDAPPNYISITGNGTTKEDPSYILYNGSGFSRTLENAPGASTMQISRKDTAETDYKGIRRLKISFTGRLRVCTPTSASDSNCTATAE